MKAKKNPYETLNNGEGAGNQTRGDLELRPTNSKVGKKKKMNLKKKSVFHC